MNSGGANLKEFLVNTIVPQQSYVNLPQIDLQLP
jgi:hypothetical protein